jgi:acetate kinase
LRDAGHVWIHRRDQCRIVGHQIRGVRGFQRSQLTFSGQINGIGVAPRLRVKDADGTLANERQWPATVLDHTAAAREILGAARDLGLQSADHRAVHRGTEYGSPARVDINLLEKLAKLMPLSPLHQPHNLAPIRAILEAPPNIPQIARFDTAFHRSHTRLAQSFIIPRQLTAAGGHRIVRDRVNGGCSRGRGCPGVLRVAPEKTIW